MWLGSIGSTAICGSLFGVMPSQSRFTFADGSPTAWHSSCDGLRPSRATASASPGAAAAWPPRAALNTDVAASGRNFAPPPSARFRGRLGRRGHRQREHGDHPKHTTLLYIKQIATQPAHKFPPSRDEDSGLLRQTAVV